MLDPSDPTVEMAVFGEEVRQFLESNIGEYLMQCANDDKAQALGAFLEVDSKDEASVRAIQLKGLVAHNITKWLAQAIERGLQARQYLESSK